MRSSFSKLTSGVVFASSRNRIYNAHSVTRHEIEKDTCTVWRPNFLWLAIESSVAFSTSSPIRFESVPP